MMKKITLFMLALTGLTINAQLYYEEDFEAQVVGQAPANFTVLNEDTCNVNAPTVFTNEAWIVSENGDAQGNFAAVQSWTNPPCQVNDWLITPQIDLTAASASTDLIWLARSFEGNFPEDYEVKISVTGNAPADFVTDLQVVNDELGAWTEHTVSLAAFVGQNVFIAFRSRSTDQSQLWIDDIKVREPLAFDLEISNVTTNAVKQSNELANFEHYVLDYSKRDSFLTSVEIANIGLNPVDSLYLTYILVNDLGAPTEGIAVQDTVYVNPPLLPGTTYTHNFDPYGVDTLFTPDDFRPIDVYVEIDSSSYNLESAEGDVNYRLLFAPNESYTIPYASGFEIADLGAGQFIFDNKIWGWKYLDRDDDGVTLSVGQQFSNLPSNSGSFQVYGSLANSQLSAGAINDVAQSPELTLIANNYYSVSVHAKTGFGATGSLVMKLTNSDGTVNNNLGTITLTSGDSTYNKHSFEFQATATGDDFMFNLEKTATGLVFFDDFELIEIQVPTATLTLNGADEPNVEYCDSTVSVNINTSGNPTSVSLDWGDGTVEDVTGQSTATHTYNAIGTYTIEVTATNIAGTANADVALNFTAIPAPNVTFNTPQQNGATVNISVGTSATNVVVTPACAQVIIDWGDGTIENITGQATATHTYSAPDSYTITVTASSGGAQSMGTHDITITGIANIVFGDYSVYPNPANSVLNVDFTLNNSEDVEISVISVEGKVIETLSFDDASVVNTAIRTSSMNNGVYILKIKTENGLSTQKFVVSHK